MSSEQYRLTAAPDANKAFAYGDDPNTSHSNAQETLSVAQGITSDTVREAGVYHKPAVTAALKGEVNAVANVNMLKIPEARKVVAARHALGVGLDTAYPMTTVEGAAVRVERPANSAALETNRQMGIAKADLANRVAAGLEPRVHDLS